MVKVRLDRSERSISWSISDFVNALGSSDELLVSQMKEIFDLGNLKMLILSSASAPGAALLEIQPGKGNDDLVVSVTGPC